MDEEKSTQAVTDNERDVESEAMETSVEASWPEFFKAASVSVKAKLVVLGVLAFVVTGASLWAIGQIVAIQLSGEREPASVKGTGEEKASTNLSYELGLLSFTVTNRTRDRTAHAQFSLVLEVADPERRRVLEINRARLIDTVLEVGSRFSLEDLEGARGLQMFKKLLTEEFVQEFGAAAPKSISVKEWVIN